MSDQVGEQSVVHQNRMVCMYLHACRATGEVLGLQKMPFPWGAPRRGGIREWTRQAGKQTELGELN